MKKGAFLEGLARFLVLTSICILCLASIVHADGYNEGDGGNGWGGNGGEIIGGDVDNGDDFPDGTSLDVVTILIVWGLEMKREERAEVP